VGDVDPPAEAVALFLHEDRVVEVLRRLRIDREAELVAEVDAVLECRRGRVVRLELDTRAGVDQQPLEHGADVTGLPERALQLRPAPADPHHDEIAGPDVTRTLTVDLNRNLRDEERLADELLAAPVDLDD